jgi:hypothetical protein
MLDFAGRWSLEFTEDTPMILASQSVRKAALCWYGIIDTGNEHQETTLSHLARAVMQLD